MAMASPSPTMYRQGETIQPEAKNVKTELDKINGVRVTEEKKATTMTIGEITATGGLSKENIRGIIEKHMDRLEKCCKSGPSKGKVALVLAINADGTIKTIKTVSDTLKNETITKCIIDEIKKFVFPAAVDGHETTATITLIVG